MLRKVFATIVGIFIAGVVTGLVQMGSHALWPPPATMDPNDMASIAAHMAQIPLPALLAIPVSWGGGTLVGAAFATRMGLSRGAAPAVVLTVVQSLSGIAVLLMIPHPLWLALLGMASFYVCGAVGYAVGRALIPWDAA